MALMPRVRRMSDSELHSTRLKFNINYLTSVFTQSVDRGAFSLLFRSDSEDLHV